MSAGIRSGVNWMRLKLRSRICGQRADQQRLGQAGHAGQQAVPAGEERDQQLIDDVVLADDDLAQLARRCGAAFDDTGDEFLGGRGHGHGLHRSLQASVASGRTLNGSASR